MNVKGSLSPMAAEMAAGLSEFCEAIESGAPIKGRYTVRTVSLDLTPRDYRAEDVRSLRRGMGASQVIFAKFLGVSVIAVRAWERGTRVVPTIARRFMDEIVADPGFWRKRMTQATENQLSGQREP